MSFTVATILGVNRLVKRPDLGADSWRDIAPNMT